MWYLGISKRANEEDVSDQDLMGISPHASWRDVYQSVGEKIDKPRKARLAAKSPLAYIATTLFKNASKEEVARKLAAVHEILKEGGEWEQGPGGSAAAGVYAMTPKSLGISGEGLGGMGAFSSIAAMHMRPTLASGMYGGWGGPGGDVGAVINSYKTMGGGGPVGW